MSDGIPGDEEFKPACGRSERSAAEQQQPIVSSQMLEAAIRKACALELFPRGEVDTDTYLKYWDGMKQCIQAALSADC